MAISAFIYPRTIALRRPRTTAAVGKQPYSGNTAAAEDAVQSGIPASIQASASFRASGGDVLPGGTPGPGRWSIFIPRQSLAKGAVKNNDIVVDDEGNRYLVADAYWNSLGYRLQVIMERAA